MPKWGKTLIAVFLLPFCIGAVKALVLVVGRTGRADSVWVALLGGAACWIVVLVTLPKPMWVYVVGHELTHAVWTWLFGGRVKKFKATSQGGHVVVTKSNFVIALAPYFFPIYAVLLTGIFLVGHLIWDWNRWSPWFHLLLGAAYAFHATLTIHVLKTRQSDITSQGYLFSAVIIFLGNILILLIALPLLTGQANLLSVFGLWLEATGTVLRKIGRLFA